MTTPYKALAHLLHLAQCTPLPDDGLTITGQGPVLPTNFLLGTAGAAVIASTGVAAAELWYLRTGRRQRVTVDLRAAAALRSDRYCRVNSAPAPEPDSPIHEFYQTHDGRWIQLHTNFPHHRDGVLKLLGCTNDRDAVAKAIETSWDGLPLEEALTNAQVCAGLVRSRDEWMAHPHAQTIETLPLFDIIKIAESPPEPLPAGERPLSGIRVLDLTHVIAGPVGGRTLAEHGADVLRLTAPHRPRQPRLDIDIGHGKRSAYLDLGQAKDAAQLRTLVQHTDVFSQGYRPQTLATRGFSPEKLAALRPGLVYVSLCAYSHAGPWQHKRGFDSLVQSVSGMVHEESNGATPRHLPAQALDYCSGYLMAFGAMIALGRRAREGGSYLVRVSLCQTSHWIDSLGRLPKDIDGKRCPMPTYEDIHDLMIDSDGPYGTVRHVAPAVQLSETPARWACPTAPFGTHAPVWPA